MIVTDRVAFNLCIELRIKLAPPEPAARADKSNTTIFD